MSKITFILPDLLGGVSSVVSNIVSYGGSAHDCKVVSYRNKTDSRHEMNILENSSFVTRFEYDIRDNLYYTVRQLGKLLGDATNIIVATDALELEMVALVRLDVKVVFIVMGDFEHYYQLGKMHSSVIDGFIAISKEIYSKLIEMLPERKETIHLAYFPTPDYEVSTKPSHKGKLRVVFVGRLEQGKNPLLLVKIDNELREKGIEISWSIVGEGELYGAFIDEVKNRENFVFLRKVSNKALHDIYRDQDVVIIPSSYEGLPVSLIESMKSGLVPVVSDIPGGIREIVEQGENGFLCKEMDEKDFAERLWELNQSPELRERLSRSAKVTVDLQFNAVTNSNRYFSIIESVPFEKGRKVFKYRPVNRLDQSFLPTSLVRFLRTLKNQVI